MTTIKLTDEMVEIIQSYAELTGGDDASAVLLDMMQTALNRKLALAKYAAKKAVEEPEPEPVRRRGRPSKAVQTAVQANTLVLGRKAQGVKKAPAKVQPTANAPLVIGRGKSVQAGRLVIGRK